MGCTNLSIAKGLCGKHRKRLERYGSIYETKYSDWGSRRKHSLYLIWRDLVRNHSAKGNICKEWATDLWQFVSDVKERPDKKYRLTRKDIKQPFGPDNWYWREIVYKTEEEKSNSREYIRKRRAEDPDFHMQSSLKRNYGITIDDYKTMHDAQNGVCKICQQPEKSVDPKTNKIRRLAVDHCHASSKIRGLLCSHCNRGLGYFKDRTDILQTAINYLNGDLK